MFTQVALLGLGSLLILVIFARARSRAKGLEEPKPHLFLSTEAIKTLASQNSQLKARICFESLRVHSAYRTISFYDPQTPEKVATAYFDVYPLKIVGFEGMKPIYLCDVGGFHVYSQERTT